jgi:hypothetical protein
MDLNPTGKSLNSTRNKEKEPTSLIKAPFNVKEFFVDDYQHYPAPDLRLVYK